MTDDRSDSYTKLCNTFYEHFDRSFMQSLALNLFNGKQDTKADFVGEGTFFKGFYIHTTRYDFCLKLLKEHELKEARRIGWLKTLKSFCTLRFNLLAPIEMIQFPKENKTALVMPFGHADLLQVQHCWQPLDQHLHATKKYLRQQRLILSEDVIQMRVWEGVPFISDVSDILMWEKD